MRCEGYCDARIRAAWRAPIAGPGSVRRGDTCGTPPASTSWVRSFSNRREVAGQGEHHDRHPDLHARYLEKYGPDERYNYLRFLAGVSCPVLVTLGEKEVRDNMVIVDTNHRRAGQALELEVELISIRPRGEANGQRPVAAEYHADAAQAGSAACGR